MNTEFIDKYAMLPEGARVLVAVSGGADSVCLLHWLKSLEKQRNITVCAAHYEHGIRGEESLQDAAFVEGLCERLNVPLALEYGNVRAYSEKFGLGLEEGARRLRYEFLEKARRELGCTLIATAHNADDNAETLIFNLIRGSAGLRGIPPVRGNIIRPLLSTTRAEIEDYLRENGLSYRTDSTNLSDEYSRNRIRHAVMPVLREINPAASQSLLRACELSALDEAYIGSEAQRFIEREYKNGSLPLEALNKLPKSVAGRVIRALAPQSLEQRHVESVLRLSDTSEYKRLCLPGLELRFEQGRLYFESAQQCAIVERELVLDGCTEFPELGIKIYAEFTSFDEEIHDLFKTLVFKSDIICGRIFCTARKNGDSLRPRGRGCTKSLKQLFLEHKYTKSQRDSALVLRDDRGILAVVGLAADERTRPKIGDRVLKIEIEKDVRGND